MVKYLLEGASEGLDMWLCIRTYGLEFYPSITHEHLCTRTHTNGLPRLLPLRDNRVDGKVKGSTEKHYRHKFELYAQTLDYICACYFSYRNLHFSIGSVVTVL